MYTDFTQISEQRRVKLVRPFVILCVTIIQTRTLWLKLPLPFKIDTCIYYDQSISTFEHHDFTHRDICCMELDITEWQRERELQTWL